MIPPEIEKVLSFQGVLGWLGIATLDELNEYYATFHFGEEVYILFKTISGIKCLRLKTLKTLTPATFLLLSLQDRTPAALQKVLDQIQALVGESKLEIPEFKVVKESQVLPNYLKLDDVVEYTTDENLRPLFYQFLNIIECIDIQFFTCKKDWEYCACIYQDSKFINAIHFNLGTSESILTRKDFNLELRKSDNTEVTYISSLNHLINDQIVLRETNLFLYKSFAPTPATISYEYDKIAFIINMEDFPQVLQSMFDHLVSNKVFSSASVTSDQKQWLKIHISGYGKKAFMIDQISEPIKQLIRNTLKPWGATGKDPEEKFLIEEDYYFATGDLIQQVNSKANDQVLTLPFRKEILQPLFNHYAKLSKKKLSLEII